MKATELREEIRQYILSDVQMSVMRLCINTAMMLVPGKDYRGNEYTAIESAPFQTMPVMFKKVWLYGTMTIVEEKENSYEVCVSLDYRWESFRGGSNGMELGRVWYEVAKDLPEKFSEHWGCQSYVNKVRGLEI